MKRLLLSIISIAILAALVFTLAGCKKEDPYIIKTEINEEGELVVHYNDGKTENLGSVENGSLNIDNPIGLKLTLKDDDTYSVSVGNAVHLSEIVIPARYAGKPVTDIDSHGFANLKNLTKITIPSSVIGIGSYAFSGCENLAEISSFSPNLIHIGDNAFTNCPKLTSLKVDELNQIYEVVDGSLYTKDGKTLVKCILPEGTTSYSIGSSITKISAGAFADCKSLKSITFDVANKDWKVIYSNESDYVPNDFLSNAEKMAWAIKMYKEYTFCYEPALAGEREHTAYKLELGNKLSNDWESLERCSWVWFEFKPTATGYYYFDFINGENELAPSLSVRQMENGADSYDYTDIGYITNSAGKRCYELNNEYTYLIRASGLSSFEYSKFDVTVHSYQGGDSSSLAIPVNEGRTAAQAWDALSNGSSSVWFKFKPTEDGYYRITVPGDASAYFYVYQSNHFSSISQTTKGYSMYADDTYLINVSPSTSGASVGLDISKSKMGTSASDAIALTTSSQYVGYDSSYNSNGEMWFKFDVTSYDDYALYLSDLNGSYHTRVYIYSDPNGYNQVANSSGYFYSQNVYANGLSAGTYYVKIQWAYGSSYDPSSSYADSSFYIYYYQN